MDVSAAMQQFYDDKGNISIPDQLTLSGMNEMLFALAGMQGTADDVLFRYHDFSSSREGEVIEWTRAQVNTRIKAVSVRLRQVTTPGDRVAILANNSPEYLIGFVGALYAGTVPVPLYDPTEPGHGAHLTAVLASSTPTVVLTNKNSAADVRRHFSDLPAGERPRILTVDALPDSLAEDWENPMTLFAEHPELAPKAGDPAFLQYTSGSTRAPAGVVLTHRNIVTNVLQVFQAGQLQMPMRLVNWLPLHHDMGIILASFCLILGIPQDIMSPRDFIQDPGRWIRQLSEKGTVGEDAVNVYAAVPNFALELAARYANPAEREDLADVDLSHVEGVINGAEAVSLQSIDRFQDVFGPYGFVRSAMRPSYGLAEATVFVSTPQTENRPLLRVFDREELSAGRIVELPESESDSDKAMAIVSVGAPGPNEAVVVVDPETGKELPLGSVGELWIHGNNVAAGYLDRDEETGQTPAASMTAPPPASRRTTGCAPVISPSSSTARSTSPAASRTSSSSPAATTTRRTSRPPPRRPPTRSSGTSSPPSPSTPARTSRSSSSSPSGTRRPTPPGTPTPSPRCAPPSPRSTVSSRPRCASWTRAAFRAPRPTRSPVASLPSSGPTARSPDVRVALTARRGF